MRLILAVLAGVLALLCLGGLGLGYVLYDKATEPDRSAPDVAVDNYLRALLVDRNDVRTAELRCGSADLADIEKLATDIEAQEQRLGESITVTWGALRVEDDGENAATVTTTIRRSANVDGATQSLTDDWRFRVVDEDGWRVCGADAVP